MDGCLPGVPGHYGVNQIFERRFSTMPLTNKQIVRCISQLNFNHDNYNHVEYILTSIELGKCPCGKKILQKASVLRSLLWST